MAKRVYAEMVWAVTMLVMLAGACLAQESASKTNILFIFADDLGYNDLSIHGSPHLKTPNMDRIAENGVQFRNAYSLAGLCSPARSSFLTGKNPTTFGHIFNPAHDHGDAKAGLPRDQHIIPQTLKKVGYATAIIGKWHLGFHHLQAPIRRGFSHFYGFLGGSFKYRQSWIFAHIYNMFEYLYDRFRVPETVKHLTIQFTDETIDFIDRSHSNTQPFFIYLSYNAPHGPLEYINEDIDLSIPEERRPYAAMVTRLDKEIGRLMAHLEDIGIMENTLVIFSNDNGGIPKNKASNFPFRGNKGSYLEGGIRIPMFMQWKGTIRPNQIIDHPVTLMDMFPTFQDVAQVPRWRQRNDLHGVSLMPYIPMVGSTSHLTSPPHEHLVIGDLNRGMVRRGQYKLFVKDLAGNETYLYDMAAPSPERVNLKSRMEDLHEELYNIFVEWQLQNPTEPAFPKELRENPITVDLSVPSGPYRRNVPIAFGATASHARGKEVQYRWEVFRPGNWHRANFLQVRQPAAPMTFSSLDQATITFTQPGRWTVRVNAISGTFLQWEEHELNIV